MTADLLATLLGIAGAVMSATIAAPQAVRAVRRGTAGVSSDTYQLVVGLGVVWTVYGVFQQLWLFAVGNGVLGFSALVVLWALRRDGASVWSVTLLALVVFSVGLGIGLLEVTWLGWYAATLSVMLRIPQMRMVRFAKSIQGVSVHTWVISLVANLIWLAFGLLESDSRLIGGCAVNTLLSISLIIAVEARRRRERSAGEVVAAQA